jgi:hypothetical protein
VDGEAIARAVRRRQVLEALEFERSREKALTEQLGEVVAEVEGPRVDESAFARMAPDEVALVRRSLESLQPVEDRDEEGFGLGDALARLEEEDSSADEEEIPRLERELVTCRSRQSALERYLEALDG